jgi:hypothetical protein
MCRTEEWLEFTIRWRKWYLYKVCNYCFRYMIDVNSFTFHYYCLIKLNDDIWRFTTSFCCLEGFSLPSYRSENGWRDWEKDFLIVRHLNFTYNKCYLFHKIDCSYLYHSFLYKWVVGNDLNSLNHIVNCLDRKLRTAVFASSTLYWVQIKVYLVKYKRFFPLYVKVMFGIPLMTSCFYVG